MNKKITFGAIKLNASKTSNDAAVPLIQGESKGNERKDFVPQ